MSVPLDVSSATVAPALPTEAILLTQIPVLRRRADGRVVARCGEEEIQVHIVNCFPWKLPGEWISIRDDKGTERCLIERLAQCPSPARELIEEELRARFFVPRILAVLKVVDELELFHWYVETDAGARCFLTTRADPVRTLPDGTMIVRDVANDFYLIADPARLDAKSRALLMPWID